MAAQVSLELVQIHNPDGLNFIIGQSHFIKTVEDIYEAIIQTGTAIKFGVAFCEASGDCLIRFDGNDDKLKELAVNNAKAIGAGHTFVVFLDKGFPINVTNAIKSVPEVVRIYCASANPVQVVVAQSSQGRGIMGVIDGFSPKGVEDEAKKEERRVFLRRIGYKR